MVIGTILNVMFKDPAFKILFLIFLANFFFEENQVFLFKRIIYSVFIYLAVYQIFKFYLNFLKNEKSLIKMPSHYITYITLYLIFIIINVFTDLFNPALNLITLINNPQAMLSVVPVFIFFIGANSPDLKNVLKLLSIICVVFILVWIIKIPGRVPYYEGIMASHVIIPFLIFSFILKKKQLLAVALVFLAIPFSMVSDQRIILLKILAFFSLSVLLTVVKNNRFFKLIIILTCCLMIFLFLTNLEAILNVFKAEIGIRGFDSNDTRSFLYQELFGDFKKSELILGRGFLGTYFSDYFLERLIELDDIGDFYQRFGVEVGFLQLILKGGFVFYFLYTLPLWYISVKSIFRHSHNRLSFYIGIYIFTELLLMFIGNAPYFGFQFSLLFFLAGYAYRIMLLDIRTDHFLNPPDSNKSDLIHSHRMAYSQLTFSNKLINSFPFHSALTYFHLLRKI